MKIKDIVALAFLALILIVIGSVLINNFGGSNKKRTAEVEVVKPIDPNFSEEARTILLNKDSEYPVKTFSAPVNLTAGFGNTDPFTGGQ